MTSQFGLTRSETTGKEPRSTPAAANLSDDTIDRVFVLTMEELATAKRLQPSDLNTDILEHKTLRRAFARAIAEASHLSSTQTTEATARDTVATAEVVQRAPTLTEFPSGGIPLSGIDWIDYRVQKPELPETPFEVQLRPNATGSEELLQFSRATNDWLPLSPGSAGAARVVTHWSKLLQVLGSPGPKPSGPRGHDYL